MEERRIPLDVFHFDCFWQRDFEWSNLTWNNDEFPDPEKLIKEIHNKGIKVCVWINPYILIGCIYVEFPEELDRKSQSTLMTFLQH